MTATRRLVTILAADVAGYSRLIAEGYGVERDRGFADSPLEGSGFELPVPREKHGPTEAPTILRPKYSD